MIHGYVIATDARHRGTRQPFPTGRRCDARAADHQAAWNPNRRALADNGFRQPRRYLPANDRAADEDILLGDGKDDEFLRHPQLQGTPEERRCSTPPAGRGRQFNP